MTERVTREQVENDTNWLRCRDKQSRMIASRYDSLAADRDEQASERSRYESLYTRADEAYRDAVARAERAERERDDKDSAIRYLTANVKDADADIADIRSQLAAAKAEIERLNKDRIDGQFDYLSLSEKLAAANAECERLRGALKEYADRGNWGRYDESGCPKGEGEYTDACFIGPETAEAALAASVAALETTELTP